VLKEAKLVDGRITAVFERTGKEKVTYSACHHTVERVTQCVVDSTKILGYVTVEYYCLYYSNICSYLVEYISRYSDSAYAALALKGSAYCVHALPCVICPYREQ
jgi:hypothetical protein